MLLGSLDPTAKARGLRSQRGHEVRYFPAEPIIVPGYYGEEIPGTHIAHDTAHELLSLLHQVEAIPIEVLESVFDKYRESENVDLHKQLPSNPSAFSRMVAIEVVLHKASSKIFVGDDERHTFFNSLIDCEYAVSEPAVIDWIDGVTKTLPESIAIPQFLLQPSTLMRNMFTVIRSHNLGQVSPISTGNTIS